MSTPLQPVGGPCSGYRVIEFATMVSGPFCGQMLADLGADVIKVEPVGGDGFRALRPEHGGLGALFLHHNRGKRSIVVDLKSERGLQTARDLIRTADVVLENFRPGVMKRLGLDYDRARSINPEVIYISITGFGDSGPNADLPAYDQVIQGLSGFMWTQGKGESPEPVRNSVVDKVTSLTSCNATLAALLHRERGGGGQRVGISLLDAYAAFIMPGMTNNNTFIDAGLEPFPPRAVYQVIATKDGHVIGNIHTDAQFIGCAEAFGRAELIDDPRFANPKVRHTNIGAMWDEMGQGARHRSTEEILSIAAQRGVPLARVNTLEDFMADAQTRHNKVFVDYHDPELGTLRQLNYPARFERSPAQVQARAPKLGEHTDAILSELGLDDAAIASLKMGGSVA